MSTEKNMNNYDADSIKVLKGLEAVRKRPGMYIGDTDDGSGLHHMIYEVVDNSIDEALAGHCDTVRISLNADGSVSVEDNGRGIPVDMHKTEGRPAIEVILTDLHAGGKFDNDSYKVSGGLHGVGVSVVNALSTRLEATVFKNGKEYSINFHKGGKVEKALEVVRENARKTGTIITFTPDPEIFKNIHFNEDKIERRLRELAFLNSNVRIILHDKRNSSSTEPVEFFYTGGITEYVKYVDRTNTVIQNKPISISSEKDGIGVEVAMQWNDSYVERVFCYTNNIPQKDGGTHLTGFRNALTRTITNYVNNNSNNGNSNKKGNTNKIKITGEDIREGISCILSVKVPDPKFSSQTKEKLVSSEVQSVVDSLVSECLSTWLDENPSEAKKITSKAQQSAEAREAARKAKDLSRKKNKNDVSTLPGKLATCQEKDPTKTELFIVEGDSAGGSAKQGRERKNQAILPLKGKILNVEKSAFHKILNSAEIGTLVTALGTGISKDINDKENYDIEKLKYHKIVIMTDADVDGEHIRTLLLTFFYRYMPDVIEKGYLYIAQPPLYRITKGTKHKYLLDDEALDQELISLGVEGTEIKLHEGTIVNDANKLKELVLRARSVSGMIETLDKDINFIELTETLALSGALHPAVFSNKDNMEKTIKFISPIMEAKLLNINMKTKWSGEVKDDGILFKYSHRGVKKEVFVPSAVSSRKVAHTLIKESSDLKAIYSKGFDLIDGETIHKVYGPTTLLSIIFNKGRKGITMSRYKGLGEMNPDQLWETTLNPENRQLLQVKNVDDSMADDIVSTLMGHVVEPRRDYIIKHASNVVDIDI